jgi:hypothetical protein
MGSEPYEIPLHRKRTPASARIRQGALYDSRELNIRFKRRYLKRLHACGNNPGRER